MWLRAPRLTQPTRAAAAFERGEQQVPVRPGVVTAVGDVPVERRVARAAVPAGPRRPDVRIEDGVDRRTLIGGRGGADDVEIHRGRV